MKPQTRNTKRVLTSVRSVKPDELSDFQKMDELEINEIGDCLLIQSSEIEHGIPRYMLKLNQLRVLQLTI